jgi:hypothetical protein
MSVLSVEFLVQYCSSLLDRQAIFDVATAQMGPHALTNRLGPRALALVPPYLITLCGSVLDSHHHFPRVRGP